MFRLDIYTKFAIRVKDICWNNWVVLHGSEGYPQTIGRDLDIICQSKNTKDVLLYNFFQTLVEDINCKWIIIPSDIWGKRILGITDNFEVCELHILNIIRGGLVSFDVNWEKIYYHYDGLFPREDVVRFAKAAILPALKNQFSFKKIDHIPDLNEFPYWIRKSVSLLIGNGFLNKFQIAKLQVLYLLNKPTVAFKNLFLYIYVHFRELYSPITPLVFLHEGTNELEFVCCVRESLGEVFLDIVCGDKLSWFDIARLRSRQRLVYMTKPKWSYSSYLRISCTETDSLCALLMDSFQEFNSRNVL